MGITEPLAVLSRRERQMMDVLYQQGRASVEEIRRSLPDPPSYSAVRAILRVLEDKGHVRHEQDGPRYVYLPTVARDHARSAALRHVVQTFFEGSAEKVIAALIDAESQRIGPRELERMASLIGAVRREEQPS
jgi:predicted transcriptional regulator